MRSVRDANVLFVSRDRVLPCSSPFLDACMPPKKKNKARFRVDLLVPPRMFHTIADAAKMLLAHRTVPTFSICPVPLSERSPFLVPPFLPAARAVRAVRAARAAMHEVGRCGVRGSWDEGGIHRDHDWVFWQPTPPPHPLSLSLSFSVLRSPPPSTRTLVKGTSPREREGKQEDLFFFATDSFPFHPRIPLSPREGGNRFTSQEDTSDHFGPEGNGSQEAVTVRKTQRTLAARIESKGRRERNARKR